MPQPQIELRTLGAIELGDSTGRHFEAVLVQPKRLALLVHLAAAMPSYVRRDRLLALFWPELDDAHARGALNQAIRFLRQQLGPDTIESRGADELRVDPASLRCDLADFRDAVSGGRDEDALEGYRGEFLSGFHAGPLADFDEWVEAERTRCRSAAARAAARVAEARERAGKPGEAIAAAHRAVELSNLDERAIRELLVLLDRLGDRAGALQTYGELADRLAQQYDAAPSPETRALIEQIRRRTAATHSTDTARLVPVARTVDATAFVAPLGSSRTRFARLGATARSLATRRTFTVPAGTTLAAISVWGVLAMLGTMGVGPRATLMTRGVLAPHSRLMVDGFAVTGADAGDAYAVAEAVSALLEQSSVVQVVRGETVAPGAARRLARASGVSGIIEGEVKRTGNALTLTLRLVRAGSAQSLAEVRGTAESRDDLIPLGDRLTRQLRRRIGEPAITVDASPPVGRALTRSVDALRDYAQSLRVANQQDAVPLVERAVKADTEFARAWHRLRNLYVNLGIKPGDRDSATVKAYRFRDRLSTTDRLRVEEKYYYFVGDRAKAVRANETVLASGDSSAPALSQLADAAGSRREFALAERYARAALARGPNAFLFYVNLAENLIEQGRLDEADSALAQGASRAPSSWPIANMRARILYHRGQLDAYQARLDSLGASSDSTIRRQTIALRADLALIRGRLAEWTRLRGESMTLNRAADATLTPTDLMQEPLVDFWLRRDTARAVARFRAAVAERKLTAPELLQVGSFYALTGRTELARSFLTDFQAVADTAERRRYAHLVHRLRGDITRSEGRIAESLDEIRRGDRLPDGPADGCVVCLAASLGDTYDRAHMVDSAIVMYERYVNTTNAFHLTSDRFNLARILERLGALHESRGSPAAAVRYYTRFVALWKSADPELQPRVAEARRRIARLTARQLAGR